VASTEVPGLSITCFCVYSTSLLPTISTMRKALPFRSITLKTTIKQPNHIRKMSTKSPFELKPKYANFKKVQASPPDFDPTLPITYTKNPDPYWKYRKGSLDPSGLEKGHVEIDPYEDGRPMISNYKLLVSGVPRPISFVSTVSKDGIRNLASFSYFQLIDHDPPIFVIGFSGSAGRPKDTMRNFVETNECVISVVSDHMIEAVNATSLDIPYEKSEWDLSGMYPAPSTTVKAERAIEAVFSIEGKLLEMKDLDYGHAKLVKPSGSLAIIQATRFWVREDALGEDGEDIDLSVMRPLVQLGGIQYGRVRETFELPRPSLATELANKSSGLEKLLEEKK
jgi:flavin reductase (DIM6/NTAB) family NADH-FMN oxidoreductase RutF